MSVSTVFFDIGSTLVRDSTHWMPGAQELLEELGKSSVRVGAISNTAGLNAEGLREHLPPDFDFGPFDDELIVLSGVVNLEKPDLRIFLKAAMLAQQPPRDCLFVGEDLKETFAAQRAGMLSLRIDDSNLANDWRTLRELVL